MPIRFRTVKLITYAVRKLGGTISSEHCLHTVYLPEQLPAGPFTRSQLINWANRHLS